MIKIMDKEWMIMRKTWTKDRMKMLMIIIINNKTILMMKDMGSILELISLRVMLVTLLDLLALLRINGKTPIGNGTNMFKRKEEESAILKVSMTLKKLCSGVLSI